MKYFISSFIFTVCAYVFFLVQSESNYEIINNKDLINYFGGCGGVSCCCLVDPDGNCHIVVTSGYYFGTGAESNCQMGGLVSCGGNYVVCITNIYSDQGCFFQDSSVYHTGNPIA